MPDQPTASIPETPNDDTQSFADAPPATENAPPAMGAIGRYTVLSLHASGGLGEIYLARDEELGRDIALKCIQERHAHDANSARRFLQEAEITARLEHPAVVPVHGLVRDDAGRPCYAMRFLHGATLTDAIRHFHEGSGLFTEGLRGLEFRGLLQRFGAVCQAVAYAHSRGVIHRDIKPHNIMLGDYGETLVVDWGLAKSVGRASGGRQPPDSGETTLRPTLVGDGSETQMGSALGTPAYMSPEQATGRWDAVGPAADIYSLGATFYHLLTGRPPFSGGDVHEIRDRVIAGDFPPPRQVNAAVPTALAAVCQKAMARKPEARYATARELAADVDHWLADEPISAYREPLLPRARRWLRRHRTLTTGVAAALVAAVLALSVGLVLVELQKSETRRQEQIAARERDEAKAQRIRTRQALDDMTSEEALDWLKTQKKLLPQQKQFLERALKYYQEFAQEQANDEASRALLAKARYRVGRDFKALGRLPEAVGPYRAALADYQKLAADFPTVSEYRYALASSYDDLGKLLLDLGKQSEAEAEFRAAVVVQQKLMADLPAVAEYRNGLAGTHNNLGNLLSQQGRRSEAVAEYHAAVALYQKLMADSPAMPDYRFGLANTHNNLGVLLVGLGQRPRAEAEDRAALTLYQKLVADFPTVPDYRHELANAHTNLGGLLSELGKLPEAVAENRAAVALFQKLAADFPSVPDYRSSLALTHTNLGLLLSVLKKRTEAEIEYRAARKVRQKLVADFPKVPDYRFGLALTHTNLGLLLNDLGRRSEAADEYRAALALFQKLAADFPAVPNYPVALGWDYCNMGSLVRDGGHPAAALEWFAKAIATLGPIVRADPRFVRSRRFLHDSHGNRAEALDQLQRYPEAAADWQRASELDDGPDRPIILSRRAVSLAHAGDHAQAIAAAEALTAGRPSAETLYHTACVFALCARAGSPDPKRQEGQAAKAVTLLRRAQAAGYFKDPAQVTHLKKDADLDGLRQRADFQVFVRELEAAKK